MLLMSWHSIA